MRWQTNIKCIIERLCPAGKIYASRISHIQITILHKENVANDMYTQNSQQTSQSPCESMKYSVVNEFQCFFVLRDGELKSWLMTCICSWL